MNNPFHLIITILLLQFLAINTFATEVPHYKLVFSVSEDSMDKLGLALNSSKNVQHLLGPANVDIEIVFYGPAVKLLKWHTPPIIADKVKIASYSGVRFVACENSMRRTGLRPSDLLQQIKYVPGGVVEILEKVAEGWTHLRP